MELTRFAIREKIMNALYSCLIKEKAGNDFDPKDELMDCFDSAEFTDIDLFAQEVFVKALVNKDQIVSEVSPFLNKWTFDRLNYIAQAIFLLAISECKYCKLTSKPVAINCAIDLAKKYLDSTDYKYINAVLDKVLLSK